MTHASATASEIVSMVQVDQSNPTNVNKETILSYCTRIAELTVKLNKIESSLTLLKSSPGGYVEIDTKLFSKDELITNKSKIISEINDLSYKIGELNKQVYSQDSSESLDVVTAPVVTEASVAVPVTIDQNDEKNQEECLVQGQEQGQGQQEPTVEHQVQSVVSKTKFPTKVESVSFKASITLPTKEGTVCTTKMSIDGTFKGSSIQDLINTLKEWLNDDSILIENMEYSVKEFIIELERPFENGWSKTSINLDIHNQNCNRKVKFSTDKGSTIEQHKETFRKRFTEIIFMLELLDY